MVLDQAVMNVSISQLVEDFDTTVTVIQGVITFYALTMAALDAHRREVGRSPGAGKRAFTGSVSLFTHRVRRSRLFHRPSHSCYWDGRFSRG